MKSEKNIKNAEFIWVQKNQIWALGHFISKDFLENQFNFDVISRKPSSSPATGFAKQHLAEQAAMDYQKHLM
jgi:2-oxoglutarate dehydrogenase E1 component